MMIFIIILLILLVFTPIPLKLRLELNKDQANLYIYFKKINLKDKLKAKIQSKVKPKAKPSKHKVLNKPDFFNITNIYSTLKANKHKPSLKLLIELEFGFEDAAFTGLFYGLSSTIYPFLYQCLKLFFKVPSYIYKPTPNFENTCFKLNIESIFYLSLVKAIYIFYILRKNYIVAQSPNFSNSTSV